MPKLAALLLLAGLVIAPGALAQERSTPSDSPEGVPGDGGPAVSIEVTIVEYLAAREAGDVKALRSPEMVDAWIKELGADQKLLAVSTIELSTVDGREGMTQFGERAAIVSGRQQVGPGRVASSYSFQEFGTIVRATPHVGDDGTIIVALQVERSDISPLTPPLPADDEGAMDVVPPSVVQLTARSTLQLKDGQTRVAYRKASSSPQGMVETVLFVTATVDDGPLGDEAQQGQKADTEQILVGLPLKYVKAATALRVLQTLLEGSTTARLEVDEPSNLILAYATPEEIEAIKAVIKEMEGGGRTAKEE